MEAIQVSLAGAQLPVEELANLCSTDRILIRNLSQGTRTLIKDHMLRVEKHKATENALRTKTARALRGYFGLYKDEVADFLSGPMDDEMATMLDRSPVVTTSGRRHVRGGPRTIEPHLLPRAKETPGSCKGALFSPLPFPGWLT